MRQVAFTHRLPALVAEVLSLLDYLDESIARLSVEIDRVIAPFAEARDRLATAPGIDKRTAEAIIGEIGVDMTRFPTAAHLASWAGMCPGQHESAGKARHGTARHGNSWLQRHLTMAAMSAGRTKNTYLAAQYRRIGGRREQASGSRKAVGHSLLIGVWHILAEGVEWDDLGVDYYDRRQTPEHRARRKLAELRSLGWTVTTNDDGTTLLTPPVAA